MISVVNSHTIQIAAQSEFSLLKEASAVQVWLAKNGFTFDVDSDLYTKKLEPTFEKYTVVYTERARLEDEAKPFGVAVLQGLAQTNGYWVCLAKAKQE